MRGEPELKKKLLSQEARADLRAGMKSDADYDRLFKTQTPRRHREIKLGKDKYSKLGRLASSGK